MALTCDTCLLLLSHSPPSDYTCSQTREDRPHVPSRQPVSAFARSLCQELPFLLFAWLIPTAQMSLLQGAFPHLTQPLPSTAPQTTRGQSELGVHTTWTFSLSPKTHSTVALLLIDASSPPQLCSRGMGIVPSSSPQPQGPACRLRDQHTFAG